MSAELQSHPATIIPDHPRLSRKATASAAEQSHGLVRHWFLITVVGVIAYAGVVIAFVL